MKIVLIIIPLNLSFQFAERIINAQHNLDKMHSTMRALSAHRQEIALSFLENKGEFI